MTSEWLMGWPEGWVTAVPGLSRNDQLKILGNGVVPQQAVAALSHLLRPILITTACGDYRGILGPVSHRR